MYIVFPRLHQLIVGYSHTSGALYISNRRIAHDFACRILHRTASVARC